MQKQYLKADANLEILFKLSSMDEEYFSKISQGALPILTSLISGSRLRILSSDDPSLTTNFQEIINQHQILHIALPSLKDLNASQNLGHILLADLTAQAGNIYKLSMEDPYFKTPHVSIFIDEAGEVVSPALVQLLNKSRGAGFSLTLAVQSYFDLAKNEGENLAQMIIDNCNTKMCLRVGNDKTAQVFCQCLSKTAVGCEMSSISFSADAKSSTLHDSINHSISLDKQSLIPYEILMRLPNFEYFALVGNNRLLKGRIPLLWV